MRVNLVNKKVAVGCFFSLKKLRRFKMKANFWLTRKWLLVFPILFLGAMEARAEVKFSDTLSVTGFLRHQLAVHTGENNPTNARIGQVDRNKINLSRTTFLTEWTYVPNDTFKLYSKVTLMSDQTEALDSKLMKYNAFPLGTPRYGSYLKATNDNEWNAEMPELYADMSLGNLWLRVGKQQIVWGEMISARILDAVNPLNLSWHLQFEPEEFEFIRVPQWAIRARYDVPQMLPLRWLKDVYVEGYLNPGDVSPTVYPAPGAPYAVRGAPNPAYKITEHDRRGDAEYGFRMGGSVGRISGTLNYFSRYTQGGYWEGTAPFRVDNVYPRTDLYGAGFTYSSPEPLNLSVSYEGILSPDEPYYDKTAPTSTPRIIYKQRLQHAIRVARQTFVFPSPISSMSMSVQYSEVLVSDNGKVKGSPSPLGESNTIDHTQNSVSLALRQPFRHNTIMTSLTAVYDLDDAHYFRPGFAYYHGDHWIFDIYAGILGGREARPGRFASMYWADEVFGRITYQF